VATQQGEGPLDVGSKDRKHARHAFLAARGERPEPGPAAHGGVRRGADLIKARALGATAAMGGRAWFWPLAAGGEEGVARMLQILRTDIERTLALLGRNTYEELDASVLH